MPRHVSRPTTPPSTAWPERLASLTRALNDHGAPDADRALAPLWQLVNLVLRHNIRALGRRLGAVTAEDVEDVAAAKTLEVLARIDDRRWDPGASTSSEISGYLAAVARNGLVDHLRRTGRRPMVPVETLSDAALARLEVLRPVEDPETAPDRGRFVAGLEDCVRLLQPKHRTIWFFRVFYELPTRRIASHPEVGLEPGNVDVILQRCRKAVSECMKAKGLAFREVPAGTFAQMWETFRIGDLPGRDGRTHD